MFLDSLTWEQYRELEALAHIKGLREDREDRRWACMTAALMSCWASEPVNPADLLRVLRPDAANEEKTLSPNAAAAFVRQTMGQ